MQYIDNYAFRDCENLSVLDFEEETQLEWIGTDVFLGCNLEYVNIPEGVTLLGGTYIFYGLLAENPIKKLELPSTLSQISGRLVDNDDEKVIIVKSDISIGDCGKNAEVYGIHGSDTQEDAINYNYDFYPINEPATLEVVSEDDQVSLTWNSVSAVAKYRVWYKPHGEANYVELGVVSTNSMTVNKSQITECGTFKVCATYEDCLGEVVDGLAREVQIHNYQTVVTKATPYLNGKIEEKCSECGHVANAETIYAASNISLTRTTLTYNGKMQNVGVIVKDSKNNIIPTNTYEVIGQKGTAIGTYAVTIAFKGEKYSGSVNKIFTINPAGTTIKSLKKSVKKITVKWNKQSASATGYQIRYATNKQLKAAKVVTVSSGRKTSTAISKLYPRTKYYVQIRSYSVANGKTYYSDWSKTKSVTTKKDKKTEKKLKKMFSKYNGYSGYWKNFGKTPYEKQIKKAIQKKVKVTKVFDAEIYIDITEFQWDGRNPYSAGCFLQITGTNPSGGRYLTLEGAINITPTGGIEFIEGSFY